VLAHFAILRSAQAAQSPGIQNVNEFNTPFQRTFHLQIDTDRFADTEYFDIPAGKTLVVEFVSAKADLPAGEQPINLAILSPNFVHSLIWNFQGSENEKDIFVGAQQIRLYAVDQIGVTVSRNNSEGFASINAHVTGYLVNTP